MRLDKRIKQDLKAFDKNLDTPEDLTRWINAIETTAKNMSDSSEKIRFKYYGYNNSTKFFVRDAKSRDYLVKSIEIHLPSVPESLQGNFSVFKYDLKNLKFDK